MKKFVFYLTSLYTKYIPHTLRNFVKRLRRFLTKIFLRVRIKRSIYVNLEKQLKDISELSIWFLPTHTWFSNAFQRPQQMARALAEVGCAVIYYEPWVIAQTNITKEGLIARRFRGIRKLAPHLFLLRCPDEFLADYLSHFQPDVLMMIWPYQDIFIPSNSSSIIVYEMIDDHGLFSGLDEPWIRDHDKWVEKADIMVTTADDLLLQVKSKRPDTLLLPNGVRIADWNLMKPSPIPEDIIDARNAPVVVGYYGTIAEWFDWGMWEMAARIKRNWSFVLIGPPYDGNYVSISERIKGFPNMYYLGSKPYLDLPNYLVQFDIATIPFLINKVTNACSPVKLFEYMAAGKPIVTSPMQEILKYKSVLVANNPEAFVNQLEEALLKKGDPEYLLTLKQEAEANTWTSRAKLLRNTIESIKR